MVVNSMKFMEFSLMLSSASVYYRINLFISTLLFSHNNCKTLKNLHSKSRHYFLNAVSLASSGSITLYRFMVSDGTS